MAEDLVAQSGIIFPVWMLIGAAVLLIGVCVYFHIKNKKIKKGGVIQPTQNVGIPTTTVEQK